MINFTKDAITDAFNRRYYEDEMKEREWTAGIALVDLDDFKLYNDTYGHNAETWLFARLRMS